MLIHLYSEFLLYKSLQKINLKPLYLAIHEKQIARR